MPGLEPLDCVAGNASQFSKALLRHASGFAGCSDAGRVMSAFHGGQYMPQNVGTASPLLAARRKNIAYGIHPRMKAQQKPVADWMREVMARRRISARAWAELAKMGKDTVSRAVRDDFASVTTTRTIAQLAEALGEPLPGAAGGVPSVAVLEKVLDALLASFGSPPMMPDTLRAFARALRETMLSLLDDPSAAADPEQAKAIARALSRVQ